MNDLIRHVPRDDFRYTSIYHHLLNIRSVAIIGCYRHACQDAAAGERPVPDARHVVGDRHACQTDAAVKRLLPDARHTRWDRHACQLAANEKHVPSDARHVSAKFDCLRIFYPIRIIIQPSIDHRLLSYLARPVIFL